MWLWDKTIIWCCNDCFDAIWFDQYQNIAQAGKTKILEQDIVSGIISIQ